MPTVQPGDIISYFTLVAVEESNLQKGMNYRSKGRHTVILMSTRKGAPYADRVEEEGEILIYEGHDVPNTKDLKVSPKTLDQPYETPYGRLTENGKFFDAAQRYKDGEQAPELVKVYEKIKDGIWVYNGVFELLDSWQEESEGRNVFKFKFQVTDQTLDEKTQRLEEIKDLDHNRIIPTSVKLEVWQRDKGKCISCGSTDNLHFDHILPYSKGGTSLKIENIQLLCARHNLEKSAKIQ